MTKWQKVKHWIETVFFGSVITVFMVMTVINFAGNIKIKERLDLMQHTDITLSQHIKRLRYKVNNLNLDHEHEQQEHNHAIDAKYKRALKDINKLLDVIKENGEYCIRRGDVGCTK